MCEVCVKCVWCVLCEVCACVRRLKGGVRPSGFSVYGLFFLLVFFFLTQMLKICFLGSLNCFTLSSNISLGQIIFQPSRKGEERGYPFEASFFFFFEIFRFFEIVLIFFEFLILF